MGVLPQTYEIVYRFQEKQVTWRFSKFISVWIKCQNVQWERMIDGECYIIYIYSGCSEAMPGCTNCSAYNECKVCEEFKNLKEDNTGCEGIHEFWWWIWEMPC